MARRCPQLQPVQVVPAFAPPIGAPIFQVSRLPPVTRTYRVVSVTISVLFIPIVTGALSGSPTWSKVGRAPFEPGICPRTFDLVHEHRHNTSAVHRRTATTAAAVAFSPGAVLFATLQAPETAPRRGRFGTGAVLMCVAGRPLETGAPQQRPAPHRPGILPSSVNTRRVAECMHLLCLSDVTSQLRISPCDDRPRSGTLSS